MNIILLILNWNIIKKLVLWQIWYYQNYIITHWHFIEISESFINVNITATFDILFFQPIICSRKNNHNEFIYHTMWRVHFYYFINSRIYEIYDDIFVTSVRLKGCFPTYFTYRMSERAYLAQDSDGIRKSRLRIRPSHDLKFRNTAWWPLFNILFPDDKVWVVSINKFCITGKTLEVYTCGTKYNINYIYISHQPSDISPLFAIDL